MCSIEDLYLPFKGGFFPQCYLDLRKATANLLVTYERPCPTDSRTVHFLIFSAIASVDGIFVSEYATESVLEGSERNV